jgi:hypothetical protein
MAMVIQNMITGEEETTQSDIIQFLQTTNNIKS